MSDILPPLPSGTRALEQSEKSSMQTLNSLLQTGGFQVTPDELSHIDEATQRNPSLLESMRKDIVAVQTNPNEKSRFETIYIKGSGVLTIDGKNMSFMEFLTKYPEQKERSAILGKMDEKTEDAFRDWEVSIRKNESSELDGALNQTTERVDNKKGALNQKLNETEQQTKELVDHARSLMDTGSNEFVTRELNQIQSDPTVSPIAQDLIKQ